MADKEEMQDKVEIYLHTQEVLKQLQDDGYMLLADQGGGDRKRLESVLPDEVVERIKKDIIGEMGVNLIRLRAEIREILDADEKEQLMLEEIEKEKEAEQEEKARQQDMGVPKNDYRRGQNSQEEDDGK